MKLTLGHIGYITNDFKIFEKFWCDILGFKEIGNNILPEQAALDLFNIPAKANIKMYEKDGIKVEIHQFSDTVEGAHDFDIGHPFYRYGVNHLAIDIDDRIAFLKKHAGKFSVMIHWRDAWRNIFIRDYEGNWIELRSPNYATEK